MTDDVIHATQYYIKYINRAILANLQRRSLKLGRLIVHQKTHLRLYNILFQWQVTLFQSPPTWFEGYKLKLTSYLYVYWIMYIRHHLQIWKWNAQGGRKWMNEWMNECVFIYRTYHIVSQGGLQFYLSEIGRQLVKAPLAAAISPYLISLTHPTPTWNVQWNNETTDRPQPGIRSLLSKMALTLRRSGTQYVTMVIKLSNWNRGAHLVKSYCKESNISDTNWLRYLFLSFLIKIWLSVWRHHLANLISLEQKEIFEIIIWLCLTRTGNYQIHEFDWLKWILTAV